MSHLHRHLSITTGCLLVVGLAGAARAADYHYTILGPEGPVFRFVTSAAATDCPKVVLDDTEQRQMTTRFVGSMTPTDARGNWPIRVCEVTVPYEQAWTFGKAVVDTGSNRLALPLPKREATRFAIIGDTGCRVKIEKGKPVIQKCTDPAAWPLPKISSMLAGKTPDLVIHVGDYIYRKAPCPKDRLGECGDADAMAYGTTWLTLEAEIMRPAQPLMLAAPWVVPRGNHENCAEEKRLEAQGGIGFFILLDPRPFDTLTNKSLDVYLEFLRARAGKGNSLECSACPEMTSPYSIPVNSKLDLWVMDSNHPEDEYETAVKDENIIDELVEQFAAVSKTGDPNRRAWLTTHRPLYGLYPGSRKKLGESGFLPRQLNSALQEAFERARIDQMKRLFDVAFTGHMHVFQVVSIKEGSRTERPPNITVGNSGTQLDEHFAKLPRLMQISENYRMGFGGPMLYATGYTIADKFGGMIVEFKPEGSKGTLFDPGGTPIAFCKIGAASGLDPSVVQCEDQDW